MILLALAIWTLGATGVTGQTCISCPMGKFKNVSGNVVCSSCAAGTYNDQQGRTSSASCLPCPANSLSNESTISISGCKCKPGYEKINGQCSMCAVGMYNMYIGDSQCVSCNTFATTNSTGATSPAQCFCQPGYSWNGQQCAPCVSGFYKSGVSNSGCSICPVNSTTPGQGSTALTDCMCTAGFEGSNGGNCAACMSGKYKIGNGGNCVSCSNNSWSKAGSTANTDCLCNSGYVGPSGGTCTVCGLGKYSLGATMECVNCPEGTFSSAQGATSNVTCSQCKSNSYSQSGAISQEQCYCKSGYWTKDGSLPTASCVQCTPGKFAETGVAACTDCGAGKYASSYGSNSANACLSCVSGKFSLANYSACDACPTGTSSPSSSGAVTNCTCNLGFEPMTAGLDGVQCTACPAGKYKDASGAGGCRSYDKGVFSNAIGATSANASSSRCPLNSECPAGSTSVSQCTCNTGYSGTVSVSSDVCSPCSPGTYKNWTGTGPCEKCAVGFYSSTPANKDGNCSACGDYSTSPAGSSSFSACECSAGYGYSSTR